MDEELPVFAEWVEFLVWLLPTTEKFPHKVRFTLSQRIDGLALDVAGTWSRPATAGRRRGRSSGRTSVSRRSASCSGSATG